MRLATVRTAAGTAAARVNDLRSATLIEGYADVGELLRNPEWRAIATRPGPDVEFNPLEVAPIVVRPEKIICVGLNYAAHIEEMGHEQPDVPTLFVKFADALIGAFDDAEVPEFNAGALDFEGELAVIIGAHARHVDDAEATACIAGYSIINDYTQRHFQKRTQQWHQGKSLEKTAGFGPWLDTEWTPGPRLRTYLNGELMQSAPTDDLVFSPVRLVSFISHLYPLAPSDVIATGTPAGVLHARTPQSYLKDGDVVRVEIDGLGAIENTTRVR
ncbi:fumarylacetoacetate hydrolase family protein [Corynebacterium sanguinis]|uniref:FAA hydrolase family protein n=1 Tax=Corynebacterium sanguinis TaxID=2594913 RepID=A0A6C1TY49_9CORY|nr:MULTISPECIES: fumarylacetoacetate hydrolase family protein [Corynebacterium]MBA4505396.1 fumarylacetoacetate hydrolase family protein [Corynebacterium sanguinis]MCT1411699.1 fumarylacetoacetate hydrolase family protein [Corynebacterium sanguinis]MCT1413636.1 fumarylacetoacetate hydrolase family protein [Corynebacterium sanguinis]MCT1444229.1 fumarylacetoacetate hydrolase family protein [Corynebacterium sanguinis]MCT1463553.1 fumarylacetoacetate hydrolase family protein [Corynebacterium sang